MFYAESYQPYHDLANWLSVKCDYIRGMCHGGSRIVTFKDACLFGTGPTIDPELMLRRTQLCDYLQKSNCRLGVDYREGYSMNSKVITQKLLDAMRAFEAE